MTSETQGAEGAGTKTAGFVYVAPDGEPFWPSAKPTEAESRKACFGPCDEWRLSDLKREGWRCEPITLGATPAPAAAPGVPDSVRNAIAFASEAEGAKNGPAARRYAALRCLGWVQTLLTAQTDKQDEPPILRATVDVFANRTDTRLSFGDRTQPEPGVKAVQQAIAALTAEYEARGGCPVVGRHPAGQSTDDRTDRCEVCNKPLIAGQRVMQDVELGTVHTACCGPEREAYVKDVETGELLGPNDPIPQGYVYEGEDPAGQERPDRKWVCNGDPAAQPAGQAGDAGAEIERLKEERDDRAGAAALNLSVLKQWRKRAECAEAALAALTAPKSPDGVRYQFREIGEGEGWKDCGREFYEAAQSSSHLDTREIAPNSTRTGAAETETQAVAWRQGWNHGYAAALAARPEAPSDAGWRPIDRAKRDGTVYLLGFYDGPEKTDDHWCAVEGWYEAGIADRCWYDVFNERIEPAYFRERITPPSDPAPSGQAGGLIMGERKPIPLTQPETVALIRLSGRRPLQLAFGTGWAALDPARSPWAVPLLERMRSLVLEDGAGI